MEEYIGEIRMFACSYEPQNWMRCDGRSLQIQDYQALYSVIGTMYGGDGVSTFNLPNLQGRTPIGADRQYTIGLSLGSDTVTLNPNNMPPHTHAATAKVKVSGQAAIQPSPKDAYWAKNAGDLEYGNSPTAGAAIAADAATTTLGPTGQGKPFGIQQPYMIIGFMIAVQGNYPPRS